MSHEEVPKENIVSLDAYRKQEREPKHKLEIAPGKEGSVSSVEEFKNAQFRSWLLDTLDLEPDADDAAVQAVLETRARDYRQQYFLRPDATLGQILGAMRQELEHEQNRARHEKHAPKHPKGRHTGAA